MSRQVAIRGNRFIGDGYPTYIIAEIGINHNGSVEIAKKLIDAAVIAGCNAVKFQKRTPEIIFHRSVFKFNSNVVNMACGLTRMRGNEMKKSLNRANSETNNRKMIFLKF